MQAIGAMIPGAGRWLGSGRSRNAGDCLAQVDPSLIERKPVFLMGYLGEASPDLCGLVWKKLPQPRPEDADSKALNVSPTKEQPWPR